MWFSHGLTAQVRRLFLLLFSPPPWWWLALTGLSPVLGRSSLLAIMRRLGIFSREVMAPVLFSV
jgi:hypothetical protein